MIKISKNKSFFILLFLIFAAGMILRLAPAYLLYGSNDVGKWEQFSTYWQEGKSPYDVTHFYNYAPLWFWVISLASYIARLSGIQFSFVVKLPIILIDALSLLILILACNRLKKPAKETLLAAGAFFLNPISILISGYHGQFCNMSTFFLLLAWYLYTFRKKARFLLSVTALSLSIAVKHFAVMFVPVFAFFQDRLYKKIAAFIMAPAVFVVTILPYMLHDAQWVIRGVFKYNLHAGYWGWSGVICRSVLFLTGIDFIQQPWFRYMDYFNYILYISIFIISFYLVKRFDLLDCVVVVFLLFYVFTTQIAPQYTVWIIPFAALRRNKYFYWYSLIGTIQILTFFYCNYHWTLEKPFIGTVANLIPETFVIFRYLTWFVCVLWLADYFGMTEFVRRKIFVRR